MFLKSLAMKGFKSFADSTVLEFEPGITVVVGPNGSGKSNVVDAVTWVLGAQGPRSLRSQKMEDVIFAGTSARPALGRAEVSLTIDNASGRLPVDMAEVTITRTLFRSGDSEYAINGSPCRLLDIQDLLSDSGVGRQQHMIIGQGQLDTVLNARPEDRRAVIEEAAGVLKHRRRRERAERRLEATGENLERLADLTREVRRQIRPLERQAAAARAHARLDAELRALRVHLAGAELAALAERRRAAAASHQAVEGEERARRLEVEELDRTAEATAAELASRREEDLVGLLGRLQGLVERSRGIADVLRERRAAVGQALDAAADQDVVSTLEAEGAQLASELEGARAATDAVGPELEALAASDTALGADEAGHRQTWGDGAELRRAEEAHRSALARVELLGRTLEQGRSGLEGSRRRAEALARRAEALATAAEQVEDRSAALTSDRATVEAALESADAEVDRLEARAVAAERVSSEAERGRHRSAARAEALARTLHELHGAAGGDVLAGVDGVVGTLVDVVAIDPGWEGAFEAAAGAAVAAVVVQGQSAARAVLGRLRGQGVTGAILASGRGGDVRPAPVVAPGEVPVPRGSAEAARPLRPRVRARAESPAVRADVEAVLDVLLADAVRVDDWEVALDLALERPDLVVVTSEGDRFAASGWRVRSSQAMVTAAAVEEAEQRAVQAAETADRAASALAEARRLADAARRAALEARRALDRHQSAASALAADRRRAVADQERVRAELAAALEERDTAARRVDADAAALEAAGAAVPDLAAAVMAATARAEEAGAARRVLDRRRAALAEQRHEVELRRAELLERRRVLEQRLAEVERRLVGHAEEREQAAVRRRRLEADARALVRLEPLVIAERDRLEGALAALQGDYRNQVEAVRASAARLEALRRERSAAERHLSELAERARSLALTLAEVDMRADALGDQVRRELGCAPEDTLDASSPDLPEGVSAAEHVRALTERLGQLGPVNPLALDELSVLEERQRELDAQVDDVRSARRELQAVVRALDEEIMSSFAAAAADVNEHFSTLVEVLFPGGTGRLVLTDPGDLLGTGVEVEVRPAGRNVRRVSLLSGGERSLVALAFLFAVFRSRPSPFYLMDEVEAALDDPNLTRFLGLVRAFRDEAQLIVVSHQKRTMETGDALYGVTMAPGGSSQVVSQRVGPRAAASS